MKRLAVAIALAASAGLSCKMQLTPDTIAKAYEGIKDARKDLTPENEYYVGRSVATTLLARNDYQYADDMALRQGRLDGMTHYVNQVGAVVAMAAVAHPREGDRPSPIAGWHFVIIDDDDTINAFAAPGGFVFVTSAAVSAARSEDELAAILAHEVAHVVRGHALGTIKKSRWAGVTKEVLDSSVELDEATLGKLTETFDNALDDMVDAMLVKGYSRDTEFEADQVGMEIMTRAGYDPQALISYLHTLKSRQDTGSGGFHATHPKADDRITKLGKKVTELGARPAPPIRTSRFQGELAAWQQGDADPME